MCFSKTDFFMKPLFSFPEFCSQTNQSGDKRRHRTGLYFNSKTIQDGDPGGYHYGYIP